MTKWRVGDVTITKIIELEVTGGSRFLLPQATPEAIKPIAWLRPHFADENGRLRMSIHTFLIQTPTHRVVVDTCLGNDKENRRIPHWNNMTTEFLADIAAEGFDRLSIDTVLCTHLHVDHVGWNTMKVDGKWVPTFPNARYHIGRIEYEHWVADAAGDQQEILDDSVTPIFDAGLAQFVELDHRISPEIRLIPSTGHTPGHVCVMIESEGQTAVITGDMSHHPCQLAHPDWSPAFDSDPKAAAVTRARLFAEWADAPILVIGTHWASPTAGHVRRDGAAFRFEEHAHADA
jgi:glyoxylase-like metal-dependent hydrolase (beta-lactamase superfamily II)